VTFDADGGEGDSVGVSPPDADNGEGRLATSDGETDATMGMDAQDSDAGSLAPDAQDAAQDMRGEAATDTGGEAPLGNADAMGDADAMGNADATLDADADAALIDSGGVEADAPSPIDAPEGGSEASGEASCTSVQIPPSINVNSTMWNFVGSPAWNCIAAGTTTINSTGTGSACPTITGDNCGGTATLDCTNSVTQTNAGGPPVMVVRLTGLTITNGHIIRLVGDKPIVFLVAGNVTVDSGGQIDASATGTTPGPGGSDAAVCGMSTGVSGEPNTRGSAGGGGGGFGTAGGTGGGGMMTPDGGTAGVAGGAANLQPLTGGCSGGSGASIGDAGTGGSGGAGGGAFEISASGTIIIGTASNTAILSAAGGGSAAPGTGGMQNNVGYYDNASGGGGSGGGILLVSPVLATFGTGGIVRVHGGGSAGTFANNTSTGTPTAGADGHTADDVAAAGGTGAGNASYYSNGVTGGLYSANAAGVVATAIGSDGIGNFSSSGGGGGGGRVQVETGVSTLVCQ
jgi:hypothetical protein